MNDSTGQPEVLHSIAQVSKSAGVSSRTLRHYDQIGLLVPDHVAGNGYRFYTDRQLVRLQQILLLKQLGLKLETIAEILDKQRDELTALQVHKKQLHQQREALNRQIAALDHSISALTTGGTMEPEKIFDGFNEQYKQEVTERWGADAYEASDRWWRSQTTQQQRAFMEEAGKLNQAWIEAGEKSASADSFEAQELAARHVQWLQSTKGTPLDSGDPAQRKAYLCNLGEMYVADPRFAKNYGGYAELVRDALQIFAERTIQLD
ncbi:UNVERIFIED_CONTAM: MerR family transcriptional regulator [Actinomycetes bacterium ARC8]|nr:MerR family transcriptional regulator [Actinomycetes bacterium ARC8]